MTLTTKLRPLVCLGRLKAFSVEEGACCSLPLITIGSASPSTREKGVLREVNAITRAMNWLFRVASDFLVSYSQWKSHRHADRLRRILSRVHRFSPPVTPCSPKAALVRLLRGRAEDSWYCVESEPTSAVGSLAVYQRKRVARPTSTLGCPSLVDLISNTPYLSWKPTCDARC